MGRGGRSHEFESGAYRSLGGDILVNVKDLKVTMDFKACNSKESEQVM